MRTEAEFQVERAERKRIYGIAKMRERDRDRLLRGLQFIAELGCASERAGHGKCATDEEGLIPCCPCIARHTLDNRGD